MTVMRKHIPLKHVSIWLVVDLPLWKICVRQMGCWHSQYMEKSPTSIFLVAMVWTNCYPSVAGASFFEPQHLHVSHGRATQKSSGWHSCEMSCTGFAVAEWSSLVDTSVERPALQAPGNDISKLEQQLLWKVVKQNASSFMPNQKDPCRYVWACHSLILKPAVRNWSVFQCFPCFPILSIQHDWSYGHVNLSKPMADWGRDQWRSLIAVKHVKGSARDPPASFPQGARNSYWHRGTTCPFGMIHPKSQEIPRQKSSVRVSEKQSV